MTYEEFFNTLTESNILLENLLDFQKIINNISKIEIKLYQLNYLLGKKGEELKSAIKELYYENKKVFEILPILVAIRDNDTKLANNQKILDYLDDIDKIYNFCISTKLDKIFLEVKNLVDYVIGVEVGLDTNSRKNRNGKVMFSFIEKEIKKYKLKYKKEIKIKNLKLSSLKTKQFDFMIKNKYLLEVNFFNTGGSKLNEVVRSYIEIAKRIKNTSYKFVWITDGKGWKSSRNKLEEAFNYIEIYNLKSFPKFLEKIKNDK